MSVRACGLNFSEVMARKGLYPDAPKAPCVVGYEASGVIDAVGSDVSKARVGERVMALSRFGAHTSSLVVPENQALAIPDALSFEQAAAIPVVYLTAYHALVTIRNIRPGSRLLVHMAAGGLGLAAIDIAKSVGDIEIFGTASPGKHALLRERGCHHTIDYRSQDYAAAVRELTAGEGVDTVLDPLGGKDWRTGYELLRPMGVLIAIGMANVSSGEKRSLLRAALQLARVPRFSALDIMNDNRGIVGVHIGHLWKEIDVLSAELREVVRLFETGRIDPVIDSTHTFSNAADAHRRIEERKNVGKVLLIPD